MKDATHCLTSSAFWNFSTGMHKPLHSWRGPRGSCIKLGKYWRCYNCRTSAEERWRHGWEPAHNKRPHDIGRRARAHRGSVSLSESKQFQILYVELQDFVSAVLSFSVSLICYLTLFRTLLYTEVYNSIFHFTGAHVFFFFFWKLFCYVSQAVLDLSLKVQNYRCAPHNHIF